MEKLLTPDEAATRLRVHVRTIYRWLWSGRLAGYRIGRHWRIEAKELEPKRR